MIEAPLRKNLLTLSRRYARAVGASLRTVSRSAHGDSPFLDDLAAQKAVRKDGDKRGSFTARKYDEIVQWFSDRWPDSIAWPELESPDASRPKPRRLKSHDEKGKSKAKGKGRKGVKKARKESASSSPEGWPYSDRGSDHQV